MAFNKEQDHYLLIIVGSIPTITQFIYLLNFSIR
jgi:hypothetical protein